MSFSSGGESATSSDEYETDSDQQNQSAHCESFVESRDDGAFENEPRKIAKARRYLLKLLLAIASIKRHTCTRHNYGPEQTSLGTSTSNGKGVGKTEMFDETWEHLAEWTELLRGTLGDKRVLNVPEIKHGLAIFDHLASTTLIPLSADKQYTKEILSRSAAKAIRPFLKQLAKLREESNFPLAQTAMSLVECDSLSTASPGTIRRLSLLSLSRPRKHSQRTLDLSFFQVRNGTNKLSDLNLIPLLRIWGVDLRTVTRLSLANNDLKKLPMWDYTALDGLKTIDLTGNKDLAYLPIHLMSLPNLKNVETKNTRLVGFQSRPIIQDSTKDLLSATSDDGLGTRSLLDCSIACMIKYQRRSLSFTEHNQRGQIEVTEDYGLPPHLHEKLARSYFCDSCVSLQMAPSAGQNGCDWMDRESDFSWVIRASKGEDGRLMRDGTVGTEVRVRGRVCRPCYRRLSKRRDGCLVVA